MPSPPLTRADVAKRKRHAERQRAYRKRLKERKKPTTEDIAITTLRCLVFAQKTEEARRQFNKLADLVVAELVALGFNPVASRIAFDDLTDRYEAGEKLTRGPNNRNGRPDISSYLTDKIESPHYSLSRGDKEKRESIANHVEVQADKKSGNLDVLRLSTAHIQPGDLELLLYEAVFGNEFRVQDADTRLMLHLDWANKTLSDFASNRSKEGYSNLFCKLMQAAVDEGLDRVIFDRDGPVLDAWPLALVESGT